LRWLFFLPSLVLPQSMLNTELYWTDQKLTGSQANARSTSQE
jgi:hypothetical protein